MLIAVGSLYCDKYFYYGRLCYCKVAGVVTPMNGTTCADKNECAVDNGGCEHNCLNTNGEHSNPTLTYSASSISEMTQPFVIGYAF